MSKYYHLSDDNQIIIYETSLTKKNKSELRIVRKNAIKNLRDYSISSTFLDSFGDTNRYFKDFISEKEEKEQNKCISYDQIKQWEKYIGYNSTRLAYDYRLYFHHKLAHITNMIINNGGLTNDIFQQLMKYLPSKKLEQEFLETGIYEVLTNEQHLALEIIKNINFIEIGRFENKEYESNVINENIRLATEQKPLCRTKTN